MVARANRDVHAKFLLRNGADEIVYPEKQLANWTAIRFSSDHIFDYIELEGDNAIVEVSVPAGWVGKTVGVLDVRRKYGINLLATKKNHRLNTAITHETQLSADETLLVLGSQRDIQRCFHI